MAIMHQAYTFDPLLFHRDLEQRVMRRGKLNLDRLRDLARETVATQSATVRDALRLLRFDEEWLTEADPEVTHTHQWYLISLTRYFEPAPALNQRLINSFWILSYALPFVGWSEAATAVFMRGQPLHLLVEHSGNDQFIAEFSVGIDSFGGWIDIEMIQQLHVQLRTVEQALAHPEVSKKLAAKNPQYLASMSANVISQAYHDGLDMLSTAVERQRALFIILD